MPACWHRAGSAPIRVAEVLLALTGYATPGLAERLRAGAAPLRHYAGFFSAHPRSADRLEALASDWLGRPVKVEQFAGAWMALPLDQRTRLPVGVSPGAFWPAGRRCGGRRARLGPAGADRAPDRAARPCLFRAAAAGSAAAARTGLAGAGLCRLRSRLRRQSGAGPRRCPAARHVPPGDRARPARGRCWAGTPGCRHPRSRPGERTPATRVFEAEIVEGRA